VDLEAVLIVLTSIYADHKRLLRIAGKTGYFDLLEAGVRTEVNESLNSRRTRFASKNLAWADSWVAKISLAVLHFNNPYLYFTDLVQKIGFDLPEGYSQSPHELFV
jgi:hypothetical protein